MNSKKSKNMMAAYDGHKGLETITHISKLIGPDLNHLSGRDLGLVMSAVNRAYHAGLAAKSTQ